MGIILALARHHVLEIFRHEEAVGLAFRCHF
jgi:hypothetical protein